MNSSARHSFASSLRVGFCQASRLKEESILILRDFGVQLSSIDYAGRRRFVQRGLRITKTEFWSLSGIGSSSRVVWRR